MARQEATPAPPKRSYQPSRVERMQSLWGQMSPEERKAFLEWMLARL